jgi:hypothetical protein
MAGRGRKINQVKNARAHEEWVKRKKLGTLDPARLAKKTEGKP